MTPEQRIDDNIEAILKAAGTSFRHYTMPKSRDELREAMRKIMAESYISGSNDQHKAMTGKNLA